MRPATSTAPRSLPTAWASSVTTRAGSGKLSRTSRRQGSCTPSRGDPAGEAEAIFHCGVSSLNLGRLDESLQHFHEALTFFRQAGNLHWTAKTLNSIADASLRQGHHREALDDYREALSIYRAMGARWEHATVTQNIGHVHLYKGDPEKALAEFRYALATHREIRDLPGRLPRHVRPRRRLPRHG